MDQPQGYDEYPDSSGNLCFNIESLLKGQPYKGKRRPDIVGPRKDGVVQRFDYTESETVSLSLRQEVAREIRAGIGSAGVNISVADSIRAALEATVATGAAAGRAVEVPSDPNYVIEVQLWVVRDLYRIHLMKRERRWYGTMTSWMPAGEFDAWVDRSFYWATHKRYDYKTGSVQGSPISVEQHEERWWYLAADNPYDKVSVPLQIDECGRLIDPGAYPAPRTEE